MASLVTMTSVPIGPGTVGLDVRLSRNQKYLPYSCPSAGAEAAPYSNSVVQFFSWMVSSNSRSSLDRPSTRF